MVNFYFLPEEGFLATSSFIFLPFKVGTPCFNYCDPPKINIIWRNIITFSCLSQIVAFTASVSQEQTTSHLEMVGKTRCWVPFLHVAFLFTNLQNLFYSQSCTWKSHKTKWNSRNWRQGLWEKFARASERGWSDDGRTEEKKSRCPQGSCWRWVGVSRCSIRLITWVCHIAVCSFLNFPSHIWIEDTWFTSYFSLASL